MSSLHKDSFICVLFNDTDNSSDCLMSNVWLMGDDLMGEEICGSLIYFGSKPEGRE